MKRNKTRNKKKYLEDEINTVKNNKNKKTINNGLNFAEFLENKNNQFLSEHNYNEKKDRYINSQINPIYSPKKPKKNNKNVINNKTALEVDKYSVQSGKNLRRRGSKMNNIQNEILACDVGSCKANNSNKNTFNLQDFHELNYIEINHGIKELQNNLKNKASENNMSINPESLKEDNKKGRKLNIPNLSDNNGLNYKSNEQKIENKNRRMTRSCNTRNQQEKEKQKEENVTKIEKIKEKKSNKNKKKKDKRRKRGQTNKRNNLNKKQTSRSYRANTVKERKEKEMKNKAKVNKKDYFSPKNALKNNYIYNNEYVFNKEIIEGTNNIKCYSPQKVINNENLINNKLLNDCIYSFSSLDEKNSLIILNKIHINDQKLNKNQKGLFKITKSDELLGRKRKRNKTEKENENKNTNNKKRKGNKKEVKEKKNFKGKSQNIPVIINKKENSYIQEDIDKLKNSLILEKNKSVKCKGKKGTRKHKSLKKKKKEDIKFEKFDQEINSVDSYSEPEKDVNKLEYFNYKNNNNFKISNPNNLSNAQFQNDNTQNNNCDNIPRNNFFSNPQNSKNANNANINILNKINSNNNNTIPTKSIYWNIDMTNDNYFNSDYSSNSIKENPFETACFVDSSNNFENSLPIDFEEKLEIKEDKTFYAKNSKYIKYHPLDKYLSPISNERKKPFQKKIVASRTNKISFSKKKANTTRNNQFDSDNEITDITSSNNDYNNELPSILNIPRIKPFKEEHVKMIKDKLVQERIHIYQTENETLQKEEKNLYIGSFIMYDEKNNIKVTVPCFKENSQIVEFMNKKKLNIIEFQEDNDIDTDEEQLELEVQRNNNALNNFMDKVKKHKDYVEKTLVRKRKK